MMKSIAVFCGSRTGASPLYQAAAIAFADAMSRANLSLVYGGAKVGLMGIIADRMLENGATVIGVIPTSLVDYELAHDKLTKLYVVDSMHERKIRMDHLSDAFVMLPGGAGSLDEFFEMITLCQIGMHTKPCAILNTAGYYNHLIQFLEHAVAEGFLLDIHREMILIDESPEKLLQKIMQHQIQFDPRWLNSAPSFLALKQSAT